MLFCSGMETCPRWKRVLPDELLRARIHQHTTWQRSVCSQQVTICRRDDRGLSLVNFSAITPNLLLACITCYQSQRCNHTVLSWGHIKHSQDFIVELNDTVHFWATFCKTVRNMLSERCPLCPVFHVCDVGVFWPNGWMDQDETTWRADGPRSWQHCVRWQPTSPPQRDTAPQFSAHICCGQMAGWIKMPLGRELGLGPSNIVLDRNPAPLHRKGGTASPQCSANVYCGQTVAHLSYCWALVTVCAEPLLEQSIK